MLRQYFGQGFPVVRNDFILFVLHDLGNQFRKIDIIFYAEQFVFHVRRFLFRYLFLVVTGLAGLQK